MGQSFTVQHHLGLLVCASHDVAHGPQRCSLQMASRGQAEHRSGCGKDSGHSYREPAALCEEAPLCKATHQPHNQ